MGAVRRLARHAEWARRQGVARIVEEDQLNPVVRIRRVAARTHFVRRHGVQKGQATPVLVLGLQRSGTNMVIRLLQDDPRFEVFSENHRRAFRDYRIRSVEVLVELARQSRHPWVVFKPLCDSHRAIELLNDLATDKPPRALWVYRRATERAASAVAKFGDANLQALRSIAAGDTEGLWQAGGLDDQARRLIRSFDLDRMNPVSAAALFWYVRNCLFFELGLHARDDVLLVSYEALTSAPEEQTRRICGFLGCEWDQGMASGMRPPAPAATDPRIDQLVADLCAGLQARLDAVAVRDP